MDGLVPLVSEEPLPLSGFGKETAGRVSRAHERWVVGDGGRCHDHPAEQPEDGGDGMAASSGHGSLCRGLTLLQCRFHPAQLIPAEDGYGRAISILWISAFTPRSHRRKHPARSEVKAALVALRWLQSVLKALGKETLRLTVGMAGMTIWRCGGVCPIG